MVAACPGDRKTGAPLGNPANPPRPHGGSSGRRGDQTAGGTPFTTSGFFSPTRIPYDDPCDKAAGLLWDALIRARRTFEPDHEAEIGGLSENENRKRLEPARLREILSDQGGAGISDIETGSEKEILRTLDAMPLTTWSDRTDALAGRFKKARQAAAK